MSFIKLNKLFLQFTDSGDSHSIYLPILFLTTQAIIRKAVQSDSNSSETLTDNCKLKIICSIRKDIHEAANNVKQGMDFGLDFAWNNMAKKIGEIFSNEIMNMMSNKQLRYSQTQQL